MDMFEHLFFSWFVKNCYMSYPQITLLKKITGIAMRLLKSSCVTKLCAKYEHVFNLKLAWKMTLVTLPVA